MAEHVTRAYGRPWSGTPDGIVRLAADGEGIVRSAGHGNHTAKVVVTFSQGRESKYDSPEEFRAGIRASDIPQVTSLMILWIDHDQHPNVLTVTVHLIRGLGERPFVTATGDDPSIVDGAARRVATIFAGRGFWQGLRVHELSRFQRVRAQTGVLVVVAVTAAITAAATIIVTKLFTGH